MYRLLRYLNPLGSWLFIVSALLFSASQMLQFFDVAPQFVSSYVDDLVVMPIILTLALILLRIASKEMEFELPLTYLLAAFILFAVAFEWWIPPRNPHFTSDWLDVVCYAFGTLAYAISRTGIKAVKS
jgi:hypothetical protein